MCLDIWWTFSGFRPLRGSVKEREHKKFIIYSLYSWGCPLIMLAVAMVMDLHPDISDDYIKPKFGDQKCWFDQNKSALYYFVGPIAFLLVCNIALFLFTAIRIRQLKNETKILQRKDSKRHDDDDNNRQRFNLYLKLFLVMGVNWIMEIISWFAGGPDYLWYVTDIGNTLQGVLIFIIFVWKDRVRRLLMERFCPKRAMSGTAKSVVTSTRSITRTSPSRTNTLNTRTQTQERNSNHEDYRMKPLMDRSCNDVP
ncbi:probable G-protein coupled receptor Mth-like 1 isoform X2 [Anabrus simplex]